MADQYEFSDAENHTIRAAGSRTGVWGGISIGVGVMNLLLGAGVLAKGGGLQASASLATGVVSIVVGATFLNIGKALKGVVETKGNDIGLMMGALQQLTKAVTIQIVVTCVAFVVGFAIGAMGLAR